VLGVCSACVCNAEAEAAKMEAANKAVDAKAEAAHKAEAAGTNADAT
jgi:hypothetical protein